MTTQDHRPRALLVATLVWAGALLSGADAGATTAFRLSDETLAERSDVIVVARVMEQRTVLGDDGQLYTDTVLSVEEALAGNSRVGERLTVRQWGGTDQGVTQWLPGDAVFQVGELAVVFLADREPGSGVLFLTALSQSKLTVVGTGPDGDLPLERDYHGLTFYDPTRAEPFYVVEHVEQLSLGALRAAIEEVRR